MSKPKIDRSVNVPDNLIRDLLTDSELRMVKQRFSILNLLREGLSIRSIAKEVGVGTDTVVRIIRMAEKRDLKGNDRSKKKGKIPWVFGKTE